MARLRSVRRMLLLFVLFFGALGPGAGAAAAFSSNSTHPVAAVIPIERQEESNWCWVAVVQNLLAHRGIQVSQEEIAARFFDGVPWNGQAYAGPVTRLLSSYGIHAEHIGRALTGTEVTALFDQGAVMLAVTRPTIFEDHALSLQGADWERKLVITSDPFTGITTAIPLYQLRWPWGWWDTIVVY